MPKRIQPPTAALTFAGMTLAASSMLFPVQAQDCSGLERQLAEGNRIIHSLADQANTNMEAYRRLLMADSASAALRMAKSEGRAIACKMMEHIPPQIALLEKYQDLGCRKIPAAAAIETLHGYLGFAGRQLRN